MTILKKVPDEDINYYFEDYIELDETRFIICGNDHFREMGDKKLLSIVEGDYYDEDTEYDYETLEADHAETEYVASDDVPPLFKLALECFQCAGGIIIQAVVCGDDIESADDPALKIEIKLRKFRKNL